VNQRPLDNYNNWPLATARSAQCRLRRQLQSLGPNKETCSCMSLFVCSEFSAAWRRKYPLRSNSREGIPIPSRAHPMQITSQFSAAS